MNDVNLKDLEQNKSSEDDRYPKSVYLSFSMYQITWTIIYGTLGIFLFFYYHAVLGLEPWLILVATIIYTIWDAINEPVFGYLLDRNFKWTRKWGRRFPWIVVSLIPWCLCLYLIFSAPPVVTKDNPWPTFWWLIISMIVFDTFITILDVNAGTLRADKFRTEKERQRYSSYFAPVDMIAQVIGMTIPPLFLGFAGEGREGFAIMATLVAFIAIISGLLFLPGAREDKVIIDRYYSREYERMGFFEGMKEVIKQKSFIAIFISYSAFGVATTLQTAMAVYVAVFILRTDPIMITIFFAVLLIGALLSVPIWQHFLKKANDSRKVYLYGGFALMATTLPLTFFVGVIDLAIMFFVLGLALGGIWSLGVPVIMANVQDEYVARTGKNQKGVLLGTWAFVGRFTNFVDELLIAIVFGIVGFKAGYATYSELAGAVDNIDLVLWGIRFLIGVIPMCVLLIGILVFWKFYDITPEKFRENREKLKELGF
ncbi:MAG: MFS transporter [Candidatus Hermodarchaeota archaeon]